MDALDILEQLENTSGAKDKIAILAANSKNKELIELLDAALNFDRKFYFKEASFEDVLPEALAPVNHADFMELLSKLESRSVSGNTAIDAVFDFFVECNERQFKWYQRVLFKDLKCGFGISSCTKAGIHIDEFEVMLAKNGKEFKKLDAIIAEGVYASPKFNGYRCLAICDHGVVTLHSRNGLEYENFPTVKATLEKLSAKSRFVLDGEIMSDDFNKMQQTALSAKSGKSVGDIKYCVFGWIDWDEWHTKKFKQVTKDRLNYLDSWFANNAAELKKDNTIEMVEYKLIYTTEEMYEFEKECLAKKYEGAMGLPNIPYYLGKKSNKLFKFKTFETWDCKVLEVNEGTGKYVGMMGSLTVLQPNGEKCGLGTGWDDHDRQFIYDNPNDFIDKYVEVSYQELFPDGTMQFPSVVRWRFDK